MIAKILQKYRAYKKKKEANENWRRISVALAQECDRLIDELKKKDQIIDRIVGSMNDAKG